METQLGICGHILYVENQWMDYYEKNPDHMQQCIRPSRLRTMPKSLSEMACTRKATMIARVFYGDMTRECTPFDLTYGEVWLEYGYFPIELFGKFDAIISQYNSRNGKVLLRVSKWVKKDKMSHVILEGHYHEIPVSEKFVSSYFAEVDRVGVDKDVFVLYDGLTHGIINVFRGN